MRLSFWEKDSWFSGVDFCVVGSGIVGLHTALGLRERYPLAKILVLERGLLPEGASTKNAGFACFGSVSEILHDLESQGEESVLALVERRWKGLELLRQNLGDKVLGLEANGGYEVFLDHDPALLDRCMAGFERVNTLLRPLFGGDVFEKRKVDFGFSGVMGDFLFNRFEAQIDTGRMMRGLLEKVYRSGILVLNNMEVLGHEDLGNGVMVVLKDFEFVVKKLLFATNGFAGGITQGAVKPARAQVLITKPIKDLRIKGTFHIDEGYYYFRNVGDRVLFGGGRNLDFAGETTTEMLTTASIQERLEKLLQEVILPNTPHEIEQRWSGIMGIGDDKTPIVGPMSDNVFCGVKMGGMGVAIGSLIGKELAEYI